MATQLLPARPRKSTWVRRFFRNYMGVAGLIGVVLILVVSIFAPVLAPLDPSKQFFDGLTLEGDPLPPNEEFRLGTDLLGRDLLSRVIYGAPISLIVGVVANGAAVLIGAIVGVVAGFFRSAPDTHLIRA